MTFSEVNAHPHLFVTFSPTQRKLSAVNELLNSVRYQEDKQQREIIRNMCISAYPDLRPWQFRKACLNIDKPTTRLQMTDDESWLMDYYYEYLSMLLHPQQGNDAARIDTTLVKEWCEWSIGILPSGIESRNANGSKRRDNFFRVAARSSSDHLSYRRDLETLLQLSMQAKEYQLALDLGMFSWIKLIADRRGYFANQFPSA